MATPNPAEIQYQLLHINEDRSQDIVNSNTICMVIAIDAVTLRFVSRRLCKVAILADDYVCLVALVSLSRVLSLCQNMLPIGVLEEWCTDLLGLCHWGGNRRTDVYVRF